jgi:hypothetical protein
MARATGGSTCRGSGERSAKAELAASEGNERLGMVDIGLFQVQLTVGPGTLAGITTGENGKSRLC